MEKTIIIRKIPVSLLLECLMEINTAGIEYVDIKAELTDGRDKIIFSIRDDAPFPETNISVKFDEDRINDLIA